MRGDEVGLLPEVEIGVGRPFRIFEAAVARLGFGDRRHVLAEHAVDRVVPQLPVGPQERALSLGKAGGIGEPLAGKVREGGGRLGDLVGRRVRAHLGVIALDELGEDVASLLEQAQQVAGQLLGIHRLKRRHVGLGLGFGLLHLT